MITPIRKAISTPHPTNAHGLRHPGMGSGSGAPTGESAAGWFHGSLLATAAERTGHRYAGTIGSGEHQQIVGSQPPLPGSAKHAHRNWITSTKSAANPKAHKLRMRTKSSANAGRRRIRLAQVIFAGAATVASLALLTGARSGVAESAGASGSVRLADQA